MAKLVLRSGAQVRDFPVTKTISIGRFPGNDIQLLEEPLASRNHCRVIPNGPEFVLEDLSSANGTLVNGRRISRHVLHPGDSIMIGATRLTFEDEKAAGGQSDGLDMTMIPGLARPAARVAEPPSPRPSPEPSPAPLDRTVPASGAAGISPEQVAAPPRPPAPAPSRFAPPQPAEPARPIAPPQVERPPAASLSEPLPPAKPRPAWVLPVILALACLALGAGGVGAWVWLRGPQSNGGNLDHGSGASDRARESALASRLALQAEGERLAEQTLAKELWAASLAGGELRRRMDNDFGFGERLIQEGNHAQAILEFEKAKQAYQELWKLFRTAQPGFERYDEARSNFRSFAPAERARCGRLEERLNAAEQALRRGFAEALCETLQGRPDAGRAAPILQKAREGLSSLREEVLKAKQALEEGRAADEAWKAVEALTERVKQHQVGELKGLAEQGGEALQRGHRALAQGSADEARECYGNVLRAARQLQTQALKLAEEQYGKAYEAFVRRQFDAAGQGFEMVLKIEPAHVETTKRMFELARLQGKEGRKYEALQTLRILRQYQPRNPNIAQAILDLNQ